MTYINKKWFPPFIKDGVEPFLRQLLFTFIL